jgi:hypothetical protein
MSDETIVDSSGSIEIGRTRDDRSAVVEDGQLNRSFAIPGNRVQDPPEPPGINVETTMGLETR